MSPNNASKLCEPSHIAFIARSLARFGIARQDIADLTQDVLVAVLRKQQHYDPTRPPEPWLWRFAQLHAHDYMRRAKRRRTRDLANELCATIEPTTPGLAPHDVLLTQRLHAALAALHARDNLAASMVVFHDLEEWTLPDAAFAFAISLDVAKYRLSVGRTYLREQLGEPATRAYACAAAAMPMLVPPPPAIAPFLATLAARLAQRGTTRAAALAQVGALLLAAGLGAGAAAWLQGASREPSQPAIQTARAASGIPAHSGPPARRSDTSGPRTVTMQKATNPVALGTLPLASLAATTAAGKAATAATAPQSRTAPAARRFESLNEGLLIDQGRIALRRSRFEDAAAALQEHAHRFAAGQLAEERDALEIELRLACQDTAGAVAMAQRFASKHRNGLLRQHVMQLAAQAERAQTESLAAASELNHAADTPLAELAARCAVAMPRTARASPND